MAAQAILAHRFVLEQKWSALLGVTLVASVVDRIFLQERLGRTAVRVMAVGAHNLAFANRHVRRVEDLRAPVHVALEAGIGLEGRLQLMLGRHRFHDRVAFGASQPPRLVHAAVPIGSLAALMAAKADGIVLFCRPTKIVPAERNDPAQAASISRRGFADRTGLTTRWRASCAGRLRRTQAGIVTRDVVDRALVKRRDQSVADQERLMLDGLALHAGGRGRLRGRKACKVAREVVDRPLVKRFGNCFHRCIAAGSLLVGSKRVREVLCLLACKAGELRTYADALLAMAPGASGARRLSGRRIADQRSLCPGRDLPRVIKGDAVEVRLSRTSKNCLHDGLLALTGDVGLHRRDQILRGPPGEAWDSGPRADPVFAVAGRAGDGLAARPVLVGSDRVSEISRVLTCEAGEPRTHADTLLAVTQGANDGGGPSGRGIPDRLSLGTNGNLPRVVKSDVVELGLAHPRNSRLHERVLALAGPVGLHRTDEIVRVLAHETWDSGPGGDPALAVTSRAACSVHMRRTGAVAELALQLALGQQPAHERMAEDVRLARVAAKADL